MQRNAATQVQSFPTQTVYYNSPSPAVSPSLPPCVSNCRTSTSDCVKNQELGEQSSPEFIFNVYNERPSLPKIHVQLVSNVYPFLVDSGSTISVINQSLFNNLKSQLKYKNLASRVRISTLNSTVEFSGCVMLSFKIKGKFFKHPIYISEFSTTSFMGIIGNDFLTQNSCVIDFPNQSVKTGDLLIPFEENCFHVNINTQPSQVNDIDKMCHVSLRQKLSILPDENVYAMVSAPVSDIEQFIFTPRAGEFNYVVYPSIHSIDPNSRTKNYNVNGNLSEHIFYVVIQNNSSNTIKLSKNMKIGVIKEISKEQIQHNISEEPNSQSINLIVPSEEILQQRRLELSERDFDLSHLSQTQQQQMSQMLLSKYAAFSKSLATLGHTDRIIPDLQFTSSNPIKCLPFPVPYALQESAKEQLNELQAAGLIERSITSWACPMLLVKKKMNSTDKTQKFRLALDLRMVNTILKPSAYPLPRISNIISNLSSFQYFSSLDLSNAYWQIDLPEKYQEILSFSTPWGTFKNKRLVFGLKNSAGTFQALMDSILHEAGCSGIFAYQDDIVIGSCSFEESILKLDQVISILAKYNITLSPAKCSFHKTKINYLGFEITQHKIFPLESNILKITSFPRPKTKRQLKTFIGVCGYYRTLIPTYATLIQPLNEIASPTKPFKWLSEHQKAFDTLQKVFFNRPFLQQPNFEKEFYLNTDASILGISGILLQKHDDILLPIAYYSKATNTAQKNYPALQLELFALYSSVKAFHTYLYSKAFIVLSDSKPLKHYKSVSSPATIITRWLIFLSEYTFNFHHIPGQQNLLADFLSRFESEPTHVDISTDPSLPFSDQVLPTVLANDHQLQHLSSDPSTNDDPPLEVSTDTFLQHQQLDTELLAIRKQLQEEPLTDKYPNFYINPISNLLCFQKEKVDEPPMCSRIVVPRSLIPKILRIAHFGHLGVLKTYQLITEKYYWKGAYADTSNYVASCQACIANKPHRIPHAPLQPTPLLNGPSQRVSMDILGPFQNHRYILTLIDCFSRHLFVKPLTKISTQAVTDILFGYICTFGRPAVVHSDLGTQFTSETFDLLNRSLGIKITHSTAAHPQANTYSERINSSLKSTVKSLTMYCDVSFDHAVQIHQSLYNGSLHSTTEYSPNMLHFGRELSLFFDTFRPQEPPVILNDAAYITNVLDTMQKVYKQAYDNHAEKQQLQNKRQLPCSKLRNFKISQTVYLESKEPFKKRLNGPYQVVKIHPPVDYSIQRLNDPTARTFKVHADRLHPVPTRRPNLVEAPSCPPAQPVVDNVSNNHSFFRRDPYFLRSRTSPDATPSPENVPRLPH